MNNPREDASQPKRTLGKSPTELLEQWDATHPPAGELSGDRYEEGSNSETVRKHVSESDKTVDPKTPKTELRGKDTPVDDRGTSESKNG